MWKTRIAELLGVDYPILQGGMTIAGNGELAGAVSEAGGFGVVSSNPGGVAQDERVENVREHIRRARAITARPIGVNLTIFTLGELVDRQIDMVIEEGITATVISGGSPKRCTPRLKEAGIVVFQVVGNVRQALGAQEAGVDAVIVEGYEAGGINNADEMTTMTLTPAVVDAVSIPVVAAGGIADARGFVAALSLGAEGVQMGTAFIPTHECHVHPGFKEAIVAAKETDTVVALRALGRVSRTLKNDLSLRLAELDRAGAVEEIKALVGERGTKNTDGSARTPAVQSVFRGQMLGDQEHGEMAAGQAAGLIHKVKSAGEIVRDMVAEAEDILEHLARLREGPASPRAREPAARTTFGEAT